MLPFSIPYYTPGFSATIQHSLLHSSIHCYHSAFPTTLQHSLLPFSIPYYTPALTATIQHSYYTPAFSATIQHSLLHCPAFTATLQYSLLPFSIPYYTSAFTATLQNSLLPFGICTHLRPQNLYRSPLGFLFVVPLRPLEHSLQ